MPIHTRLLASLRRGKTTDASQGSSRVEVAVTAVLIVASAATFLGPASLGDDGPKPVTQAYLSGELRADAAAVNSATNIHTDRAGSADSSLLDERALRAALANQVSPPSSIQVGEPKVTGNVASLDVAYRAGDATQHIKLTLDRVFPLLRLHGIWKVRVEPSFLRVQVPPAAGDVTVDGLAVHVPAGRPATIAVLPGQHLLSTTGGALIAGESDPYCPPTKACRWLGIDPAGSAQQQRIGLKLTPAGMAAAAKAVTAAFASCSGPAAPGPTACPQTFAGFGASSISWSLVGDPNSDAQLGVDAATGAVQVFGQYRMIATADYGIGVSHEPSGGAYSLLLKPAGTAFTPGPIASATLPLANRPAAATDQGMFDVVRAALAKCAQMTVASPPDCPQTVNANASNVSWSIQGDPMAGSAVAFDPATDSFQVAGRMTLRYQYDSSLLGIALHNDGVSDYPFTAHLFWDGQQPILVTIDGSTRR